MYNIIDVNDTVEFTNNQVDNLMISWPLSSHCVFVLLLPIINDVPAKNNVGITNNMLKHTSTHAILLTILIIMKLILCWFNCDE